MKTIYELFRKVETFGHSRCLPIEGLFLFFSETGCENGAFAGYLLKRRFDRDFSKNKNSIEIALQTELFCIYRFLENRKAPTPKVDASVW